MKRTGIIVSDADVAALAKRREQMQHVSAIKSATVALNDAICDARNHSGLVCQPEVVPFAVNGDPLVRVHVFSRLTPEPK